ncbi:MAG: hypothetical protein GY748_00345 [Planctomycetaceae bacterium]|nr:hypothetical protein [Planctomycetaceae bacterium]MCP4476943.1 hypothetical protein [Planctomycetaceae bacterium]
MKFKLVDWGELGFEVVLVRVAGLALAFWNVRGLLGKAELNVQSGNAPKSAHFSLIISR